jgi:hypothetical protein
MAVESQHFCRMIVAVVREIRTFLDFHLPLFLLDLVLLSLCLNFIPNVLRLLNVHFLYFIREIKTQFCQSYHYLILPISFKALNLIQK